MVLVKRSSDLVHHPLAGMAVDGTRVVIATGKIARVAAVGRTATVVVTVVAGRRNPGRTTVKVVAVAGKIVTMVEAAAVGIKAVITEVIMVAVGAKVVTTLVATKTAV